MMGGEQAVGCLEQVRAATRGQLRIYLGIAPGAGKTCAMLNEAHQRAERGTDVVVAYVNTRGRPGTAARLEGLEVIPRATVAFGGTIFAEPDLDAVLARRPQVALLDDLAHSNTLGSRHGTRWQDTDELLEAGIDVISTVNIQQLDSLSDVAEKITAMPAGETVPDAIVRAADEVQLVDMTAEALRDRMAHGDIYPAGQAKAALAGCFRTANLYALRQLALRWLAANLAEDRHRNRPGGPRPDEPEARERVVVALSGGPEGDRLIRRAARIAARSAGDLLAVHVARPGGPAGPGRAAALTAQRQLVRSVGGTYHQLSDHDIPPALLTFARAENATQLVLGRTRRSWRPARLPTTATWTRILRGPAGIDVHIITCTQMSRHTPPTAPVPESKKERSDDEAGRVLTVSVSFPACLTGPSGCLRDAVSVHRGSAVTARRSPTI